MKPHIDVTLYGHLTKDIIFEDFNVSYSIGSMANVWKSLLSINPNLSIHLEPTELGEALIYVDKVNNIRISKPLLNLKHKSPKIIDSKWSHILYINNLSDISFIKDIKSGIISCDVSQGKKLDLDILKYIDFLFISDEDLFMDLKSLGKLIKGWVIMHHPGGSISTNGNITIKITNKKTLKNINVLGAGDIFASNFIVNNLKTNLIKKSIIEAHKNTYLMLRKFNEE